MKIKKIYHRIFLIIHLPFGEQGATNVTMHLAAGKRYAQMSQNK
jgi:hypothetical protein